MLNRTNARREGPATVGLIDIGSSKVVCLIARIDPRRRDPHGLAAAEIAGAGLQRSRGVKAGVIVDLEEAASAVRAAVGLAERMAGETIENVYICTSAGRLRSHNFAANGKIELGMVTDADVRRLLQGGHAYAARGHRTVLHLNELGYRLDGTEGVRDPRGLAAATIAADLHAVTADEAPIRNLTILLERCYLATRGLVATPLASALAATTEEERRLGVTLIDIGDATATIAGFAEGAFLFTDAVTIGGHLVTCDIGRALQTPLAEAERIKTLYGTLTVAQSDSHEVFSYPVAGGEAGLVNRMSRAHLAEIMRPRFDSILALISERLEKSGVASFCGDRVVLAGGSSQMVGFGEYAANVLRRPTRVARLAPVPALPGGGTAPQFAAVAGLLIAARGGAGLSVSMTGGAEAPEKQGYWGRVGDWLQQGF